MSEEKNLELMHNFNKLLEEGNIEKALSLCTEDVTFVNPFGKFSGKEQCGNYLKWLINGMQDMKFKSVGVGFFVQGDKGIDESIVKGKLNGEKVEFLGICTFQFSNGKIKEWHDVFDRLSIINQSVKSWLPKKMVNTIVQQSRKGLD